MKLDTVQLKRLERVRIGANVCRCYGIFDSTKSQKILAKVAVSPVSKNAQREQRDLLLAFSGARAMVHFDHRLGDSGFGERLLSQTVRGRHHIIKQLQLVAAGGEGTDNDDNDLSAATKRQRIAEERRRLRQRLQEIEAGAKKRLAYVDDLMGRHNQLRAIVDGLTSSDSEQVTREFLARLKGFFGAMFANWADDDLELLERGGSGIAWQTKEMQQKSEIGVIVPLVSLSVDVIAVLNMGRLAGDDFKQGVPYFVSMRIPTGRRDDIDVELVLPRTATVFEMREQQLYDAVAQIIAEDDVIYYTHSFSYDLPDGDNRFEAGIYDLSLRVELKDLPGSPANRASTESAKELRELFESLDNDSVPRESKLQLLTEYLGDEQHNGSLLVESLSTGAAQSLEFDFKAGNKRVMLDVIVMDPEQVAAYAFGTVLPRDQKRATTELGRTLQSLMEAPRRVTLNVHEARGAFKRTFVVGESARSSKLLDDSKTSTGPAASPPARRQQPTMQPEPQPMLEEPDLDKTVEIVPEPEQTAEEEAEQSDMENERERELDDPLVALSERIAVELQNLSVQVENDAAALSDVRRTLVFFTTRIEELFQKTPAGQQSAAASLSLGVLVGGLRKSILNLEKYPLDVQGRDRVPSAATFSRQLGDDIAQRVKAGEWVELKIRFSSQKASVAALEVVVTSNDLLDSPLFESKFKSDDKTRWISTTPIDEFSPLSLQWPFPHASVARTSEWLGEDGVPVQFAFLVDGVLYSSLRQFYYGHRLRVFGADLEDETLPNFPTRVASWLPPPDSDGAPGNLTEEQRLRVHFEDAKADIDDAGMLSLIKPMTLGEIERAAYERVVQNSELFRLVLRAASVDRAERKWRHVPVVEAHFDVLLGIFVLKEESVLSGFAGAFAQIMDTVRQRVLERARGEPGLVSLLPDPRCELLAKEIANRRTPTGQVQLYVELIAIDPDNDSQQRIIFQSQPRRPSVHKNDRRVTAVQWAADATIEELVGNEQDALPCQTFAFLLSSDDEVADASEDDDDDDNEPHTFRSPDEISLDMAPGCVLGKKTDGKFSSGVPDVVVAVYAQPPGQSTERALVWHSKGAVNLADVFAGDMVELGTSELYASKLLSDNNVAVTLFGNNVQPEGASIVGDRLQMRLSFDPRINVLSADAIYAEVKGVSSESAAAMIETENRAKAVVKSREAQAQKRQIEREEELDSTGGGDFAPQIPTSPAKGSDSADNADGGAQRPEPDAEEKQAFAGLTEEEKKRVEKVVEQQTAFGFSDKERGNLPVALTPPSKTAELFVHRVQLVGTNIAEKAQFVTVSVQLESGEKPHLSEAEKRELADDYSAAFLAPEWPDVPDALLWYVSTQAPQLFEEPQPGKQIAAPLPLHFYMDGARYATPWHAYYATLLEAVNEPLRFNPATDSIVSMSTSVGALLNDENWRTRNANALRAWETQQIGVRVMQRAIEHRIAQNPELASAVQLLFSGADNGADALVFRAQLRDEDDNDRMGADNETPGVASGVIVPSASEVILHYTEPDPISFPQLSGMAGNGSLWKKRDPGSEDEPDALFTETRMVQFRGNSTATYLPSARKWYKRRNVDQILFGSRDVEQMSDVAQLVRKLMSSKTLDADALLDLRRRGVVNLILFVRSNIAKTRTVAGIAVWRSLAKDITANRPINRLDLELHAGVAKDVPDLAKLLQYHEFLYNNSEFEESKVRGRTPAEKIFAVLHEKALTPELANVANLVFGYALDSTVTDDEGNVEHTGTNNLLKWRDVIRPRTPLYSSNWIGRAIANSIEQTIVDPFAWTLNHRYEQRLNAAYYEQKIRELRQSQTPASVVRALRSLPLAAHSIERSLPQSEVLPRGDGRMSFLAVRCVYTPRDGDGKPVTVFETELAPVNLRMNGRISWLPVISEFERIEMAVPDEAYARYLEVLTTMDEDEQDEYARSLDEEQFDRLSELHALMNAPLQTRLTAAFSPTYSQDLVENWPISPERLAAAQVDALLSVEDDIARFEPQGTLGEITRKRLQDISTPATSQLPNRRDLRSDEASVNLAEDRLFSGKRPPRPWTHLQTQLVLDERRADTPFRFQIVAKEVGKRTRKIQQIVKGEPWDTDQEIVEVLRERVLGTTEPVQYKEFFSAGLKGGTVYGKENEGVALFTVVFPTRPRGRNEVDPVPAVTLLTMEVKADQTQAPSSSKGVLESVGDFRRATDKSRLVIGAFHLSVDNTLKNK